MSVSSREAGPCRGYGEVTTSRCGQELLIRSPTARAKNDDSDVRNRLTTTRPARSEAGGPSARVAAVIVAGDA